MKLSIIIPVYNGEKYLKQCLDSIFSVSTSFSYEVILIDDGSTDHSKNIYDLYHLDYLHVFKNANHGVSYSRNYGLSKANGEWILFLDCDDFLDDDWSKKIKNHLNSSSDVLLFTKESFINQRKEDILDGIFKITKQSFFSIPGSKMFKKSFLDDNEIKFKEQVINGEDMLFNASAILKSKKYEIVSDTIYNYRINQNSVTKKFNEKIFSSDQLFHQYLKDVFADDSKLLQKYSNHCSKNALCMFINRLSFLKLSEARKYFEVFKEPYYQKIIENSNVELNIRSMKSIQLYCIKKNKIKLAIQLTKIKNYIKKVTTYKNKDEIIIKV